MIVLAWLRADDFWMATPIANPMAAAAMPTKTYINNDVIKWYIING